MAARRLREPVTQMADTLVVAKMHARQPDLRERRIIAIMQRHGMPLEMAERRFSKAVDEFAPDSSVWSFDIAWSIAWKTIYWPHQTPVRHAEQEVVEYARTEFAAAWAGETTAVMRLRDAVGDDSPVGSLFGGGVERAELVA
jgi:hypothetical protein